MPYSWIPTRWPANGRCLSTSCKISRHVCGGSARKVGSTPRLLRATTGLGPRAIVVVSAKAVKNRSRSTCLSTTCVNVSTPTPVSKMTTSISAVIKRCAKSMACLFSSRGTSRIEGLTCGVPPCRSISRSISWPRRLSKAAICNPTEDIKDVQNEENGFFSC